MLYSRGKKKREIKRKKINSRQVSRCHNLQRAKRWNDQTRGFTENENGNILRLENIQCDYLTRHQKLDLPVVNKEGRILMIIDLTCPGDMKVLNDNFMYNIRWIRQVLIIVMMTIEALVFKKDQYKKDHKCYSAISRKEKDSNNYDDLNYELREIC